MIYRLGVIRFALLAALAGATGCASINKLHSSMDMAVTHIAEKTPHEFEGCLTALQNFGPMTAIQFSDGHLFDVVEAPAGLLRGDVVRIYKTEKGYVAHLWRRANGHDLTPS